MLWNNTLTTEQSLPFVTLANSDRYTVSGKCHGRSHRMLVDLRGVIMRPAIDVASAAADFHGCAGPWPGLRGVS